MGAGDDGEDWTRERGASMERKQEGAWWGSGVLIQRMDVNSSQGIFVLT